MAHDEWRTANAKFGIRNSEFGIALMSALNLILPALATAECGVRSAECGISGRADSTSHFAFRNPQFESVMERLWTVSSPQSAVASQAADDGLTTVGREPATGHSGQTVSSDSPGEITNASGESPRGGIISQCKPVHKKSGAGEAGSHCELRTLNAELEIPLSLPASIVPVMAESAMAAAQIVPCEKAGAVPAGLPATPRNESVGVVAVGFENGKSTPGGPGAVAVAQNPGSAASRISEPADFLSRSSSAGLPAGPAKVGAGSENHMAMPLPESLSPITSGAPGNGLVRSENQFLPVEPPPGVSVSSSGKSEEEFAALGEKLPEIQKLPDVTTVGAASTSTITSSTNPMRFDGGTAVAQQEETMKSTAKKTNFSEAKQKLPASGAGGGAAAPAAGENLPATSKREAAPSTIIVRTEPVLAAGAGISGNAGDARAIMAGAVNLIHLPAVTPHYVERTREMVSLQAMYLREAGAEEMRVVIKPDAGLQLSLHLQQRDGGVEVQAVLDRGNFGLLNRHWPELQQQLESRGVRVAPLASADETFGGGSEGFRHPTTSHGQQAENDADPAGAPAVLIPGLPPAAATASASRLSSTRLETWA